LEGNIALDFSLAPFVCLEHLKFTDGFKDGFDRVLASVPTKLISFELQIHSDDAHQQPISFAHPYLSRLETLTFEATRTWGFDNTRRYTVHIARCEKLMDDMTKTLTTIQTFTMDSVTFRSYDFLARLRQLRTLTWIRESDMDFPKLANQRFLLRIFDDWPVKPRVTVLTQEETEEDGIWKRKSKWPVDSAYYSQHAGRWPSHICRDIDPCPPYN
jgi:hypothetical protein